MAEATASGNRDETAQSGSPLPDDADVDIAVTRKARRWLRKAGEGALTVDLELRLGCQVTREATTTVGAPPVRDTHRKITADGVDVYVRQVMDFAGDGPAPRGQVAPRSLRIDVADNTFDAEVSYR